MVFKNPAEGDIPRLMLLWKAVFGDSDSFIKGFFSVAFGLKQARIALTDNRIIAALYIFDCFCKGEKLAYIYAVQTDPEFRGQGICRGLFEDTHRYLSKKGYKGAILVPSSKALEKMYEKFGYSTVTEAEKITAVGGENRLSVNRIGPREYESIRKKMLGENAVLQEGVSIDFLSLNEELYSGCGFLLAAHRENGRLIFAEYLGDNTLLPDIVFSLGCNKGSLKIPHTMYMPFFEDSPTPDYFGLSFE